MKNEVTINIKGVNLDKLTKKLSKLFLLKNINRITHKEIEFDISAKNVKRLFANIDKKCYNISVVNHKGFSLLLKQSICHIGIIIAISLGIIASFILSNTILKIDIYGTYNINEFEIEEILKENNIYIGAKNRNQYDDIEKILQNEFEEISLVSIIQKGNYLIINIKEKNFVEIQELGFDIVAECDGIIEKIVVNSGTPLKKVGDSFKKGDILVKGEFTQANGEVLPIKATANIEYLTYLKKEITIFNEEIVTKRTGDKINYQILCLGKNDFKISKTEKSFIDFEIEENVKFLLPNNFIPLKIKNITMYELKYEIITHNFELEKTELIEKNQSDLYKELENKNIKEIFSKVQQIEGGHIISSFAVVLESLD